MFRGSLLFSFVVFIFVFFFDLISIFLDIDECDPKSIKQHNCSRPDQCINSQGGFFCCGDDETVRNNRCVPCFQEPQPQIRKEYESSSLFDFLRSKKVLENFTSIITCQGPCDGGYEITTRVQNNIRCIGRRVDTTTCGFPCANLTSFDTAKSALNTLETELTRSTGFSIDLGKIFGCVVNISTPTQKRGVTDAEILSMNLNPCPGNLPYVTSFISDLAKIIVPNIPNMEVVMKRKFGACEIEVTSVDPLSSQILGPLIGALLR